MQPFVAYADGAWTYSVNTELSYNWTASELSGPLTFGVSKLVKFGDQIVQLAARARYWVADTDTSPQDFGFQLQATFVFPE